ncbi:MAG: replicative DNA helicase [Alphaproteobacteria bacterium]
MPEPAPGLGARTPPHNFEAEMALLGAILANNRAYDAVSEFLLDDHFADRRHGRIYAACARLIDNGLIADPVTLKNLFEQDGALEEIGGAGYLARLAASVVTIINAKDYGQTIYDRFLRRALINIGSDTANRAYDMTLDYDAKMQIEIAETELYNLAMSGDYERDFKDFGQAMTEAVRSAEAAFKREGNLAGIATHLIDVDKLLGGLHTSDLLILAGRPSMGKTALATNIAFNAAKAFRTETDEAGQEKVVDGAVVAFFSLEMSAEELATRILAEQSGISSHKIRRGEISHDEFPRLAQVAQELNRLPLYIDDTAGLTVSALRTRARRLQRQKKMSLIIVDYLQLLRPSMGTRPENRVQELSEITRSLKNLAKDLKVPIVALSQLSRQVENRDDKRPQLADLRESGSIEQDADVVMFVYREEYYLARTEPPEGTEKHTEWQVNMDRVHNMAELIIGKQRHGPIGTVKLYFDPTLTKFDNLAAADYQSGYGD